MVRIIRQKGSHFYHYRSECDLVTIVSRRYIIQLPGLYLALNEHQTMIGCRMPLFILSSTALRYQTEKLANSNLGQADLSSWYFIKYYWKIKTLEVECCSRPTLSIIPNIVRHHLIAPVLSLIFVNDLCRPLEDLISIMSSIEREVIIS